VRRIDLNANRGLYSFGHLIEKELRNFGSRDLASIARQNGVSVAEARTALAFVRNVRIVSRAAGAACVELVLSQANPLLTPVMIEKLAKKRPESARKSLRNAELGYHPFAGVVPDGLPAREGMWHHDLARLEPLTAFARWPT
jgi:hypothetical protein